LLYLPGQLTDGIEPSDDPLIDVRDRRRQPDRDECERKLVSYA
jgi:hypothetical protein